MRRRAPMREPKAGPAAYLLLRGEGNRRTQAGPTDSASFCHEPVLYSESNTGGSLPSLLAYEDESEPQRLHASGARCSGV
jgi:hypothetical protein